MTTALAVCLGACAGALARWQLGLWFNTSGALLPWGTLIANWVGAYAIGVLLVFFQQHPGLDEAWRLGLITGLLGALTTFSTFSAEAVSLLQHGRVLMALGHSGLHLVGSLLLTWAGIASARLWWPT